MPKTILRQSYVNKAQRAIRGIIRRARKQGMDPLPFLEDQAKRQGMKESMYRKIYKHILDQEDEDYIGEIEV